MNNLFGCDVVYSDMVKRSQTKKVSKKQAPTRRKIFKEFKGRELAIVPSEVDLGDGDSVRDDS